MYTTYEAADQEINNLLMQCVPDEDGCYPDNIDETEQRIADLLSEQYARGEAICRAYLSHMATAKAIKAEEDRLKKRREQEEKSAETLKDLLSRCLGEGKHQFGAFVLASKKTPATLRYSAGMSEDKLLNILMGTGSPYVTTKTTHSIDKTSLKAAIQLGQMKFEGVTLEQGVSYSIK